MPKHFSRVLKRSPVFRAPTVSVTIVNVRKVMSTARAMDTRGEAMVSEYEILCEDNCPMNPKYTITHLRHFLPNTETHQ